jgi:uncharacterized protein involved in cysteine biosynthesis
VALDKRPRGGFYRFKEDAFFLLWERTLFTPVLRAIAQLDDPALLGVLLQTVLLSTLGFAGIAAGAVWFVHHMLAHGTLGWIAGALSGGLALAAAFWLFVPMAVVIAGLFMGPVCGAVERRWYPGLPAPRPASPVAQVWDSLAFGLQVLMLSLFSLLLAPTGIGLAIGWLITAWAVGRGFFVAVAMRRMNRAAALSAYRQLRGPVLVQGAVLTLGGTIPMLNLLLPILGPAAMVHLALSRPPVSQSLQ